MLIKKNNYIFLKTDINNFLNFDISNYFFLFYFYHKFTNSSMTELVKN